MSKERSFRYKLKNITVAAAIGVASVFGGSAEQAIASQAAVQTGSFVKFQEEQEKRSLRVIFIHGWQGGGINPEERDGTWLDPLKDFTQDNGIETVFPDFTGGITPHANIWKEKLRDEVQSAIDADKNVVLMGYSLGSRAGLLFIEACLNEEEGYSREMLEHVSALILVAPLSNDTENANRRDGAYADFFDHRIDLQQVSEAIPLKKVVHSKDDPQVPFGQGESVAGDLGADLISPDDKKHFYEKEDGAVVIEVLEEVLRTYSETDQAIPSDEEENPAGS